MKEEYYSLVGVDGNAYLIMAYVQRAMRQCGKTREEQDAYINDAENGDYDHLLSVSMDMIDKLNEEIDAQ